MTISVLYSGPDMSMAPVPFMFDLHDFEGHVKVLVFRFFNSCLCVDLDRFLQKNDHSGCNS